MKKALLFHYLFFNVFYIVALVFLSRFNLNGMTDDTYYLSSIYNFWNLGRLDLAIDRGIFNNFLANHFNPMLIILSPLAYIFPKPLHLLTAINYIFIALWYMASIYIIIKVYGEKVYINLKFSFSFFILFFIFSATLFNTFINYNGLHSVLFAMPFLTLAHYFLFINRSYILAVLFYLPALLTKEEYWLLFIFFSLSVFIMSKEKKYLLLFFGSLIGFYLVYAQLMPWLGGGVKGVHIGHYNYLIDALSLDQAWKNFISLPQLLKKGFLLVLFFLPALFLLNGKLYYKEWRSNIGLILSISPTIGYCYLSSQASMSYFTHEHYSLPIISVLFALIINNISTINRLSIIFYIMINLVIIMLVLYFKQPWQYASYQDEPVLQEKILPKLNLNYTDYLLVDDRTGVYFSHYQVDYFSNISNKHYRYEQPKYIIINTRYIFLRNNTGKKNDFLVDTYEYLRGIKELANYEIIISIYPFLVFVPIKDRISSHSSLSKFELKNWDIKSFKSNVWLKNY